MLDIAQQGEGAVISLSDIASRQDISAKYLEQLAMKLSRAGLLKSIRGVQGGYLLTRTPAEYRGSGRKWTTRSTALWIGTRWQIS
jgi:Rrf2 family protein